MYKELLNPGSAKSARLYDIKEILFAHNNICPHCHTDTWSKCIESIDTKEWDSRANAYLGYSYDLYSCARCEAKWRIFPEELNNAAKRLLKMENEKGAELLDYEYDLEI